jgi:hypothetical protein
MRHHDVILGSVIKGDIVNEFCSGEPRMQLRFLSFLILAGTCMGMQIMTIIVAGDWSALERYAFDSERVLWPIHFTKAALGRCVRHNFVIGVHSSIHSTWLQFWVWARFV